MATIEKPKTIEAGVYPAASTGIKPEVKRSEKNSLSFIHYLFRTQDEHAASVLVSVVPEDAARWATIIAGTPVTYTDGSDVDVFLARIRPMVDGATWQGHLYVNDKGFARAPLLPEGKYRARCDGIQTRDETGAAISRQVLNRDGGMTSKIIVRFTVVEGPYKNYWCDLWMPFTVAFDGVRLEPDERSAVFKLMDAMRLWGKDLDEGELEQALDRLMLAEARQGATVWLTSDENKKVTWQSLKPADRLDPSEMEAAPEFESESLPF